MLQTTSLTHKHPAKESEMQGRHLFWKPSPKGRQGTKSPTKTSLFPDLALPFVMRYDFGARLRNAVCSIYEKSATYLYLGTRIRKDLEA